MIRRTSLSTPCRRACAFLFAAILIAWNAGLALAQTGTFTCHDDTGQLDCKSVERAAAPLLERGARVAVYLVQRGDDSGDDVLARLQSDQLANGSRVNPELFAIYVSLAPRYAELRAGDTWMEQLPDAVLSDMRASVLTPELRNGDFTAGFGKTLAAAEQSLVRGSGDAPGPRPASPFAPVWMLALSIGAAIGLGGGGYAVWLWRRDRRALRDAKWYVADLRANVQNAFDTIEGGLKTEAERAALDAEQFAAAELEQFEQQREQARTELAAAQEQYGKLNHEAEAARDHRPTYERLAGEYRQLLQSTTPISERLDAIATMRGTLEERARKAEEALASLRNQLRDAALSITGLGLGLDGDAALAGLHAATEQFALLRERGQTGKMLDLAGSLSHEVTSMQEAGDQLAALNAGLADARTEIGVLEALGYLTTASANAVRQGEQAYAQAVQAFGSGAAFEQPLEEGNQALSAAIQAGRGQLPEASVERRLFEIGLQAGRVVALIEKARAAFDLVDEFAESTWQDIRGNGSQAERLAAEAHAGWQTVLDDVRSHRHDNRHDMLLERAAGQFKTAGMLAQAILDRLADLERARAIAHDELEAARQDIQRGREYVTQHDDDVGAKPAVQLERAANHLRHAEEEAARERPNWLQLVRLAQQANAEADKALLGARSEVEATDSLRRQASSAEQLARGEVDRVQRYFDTHRSDISWSSSGQLSKLREHLAAGTNLLSKALTQSDELRRATLLRAIERFKQADTEADSVFSSMSSEVASTEASRYEASSSSSSSSSDWSWSSSSSSSGSSWGSGGSSGGSSWGSGGSSGGSSWGGGSKSGGGW